MDGGVNRRPRKRYRSTLRHTRIESRNCCQQREHGTDKQNVRTYVVANMARTVGFSAGVCSAVRTCFTVYQPASDARKSVEWRVLLTGHRLAGYTVYESRARPWRNVRADKESRRPSRAEKYDRRPGTVQPCRLVGEHVQYKMLKPVYS